MSTTTVLSRLLSGKGEALSANDFRMLLANGGDPIARPDRIKVATALADQFHDPEYRAVGYDMLLDTDPEVVQALCAGFREFTAELSIRTRLCGVLEDLCAEARSNVSSVVAVAQLIAKWDEPCVTTVLLRIVLPYVRKFESPVRVSAALGLIKLVKTDQLKRALNLMLPIADQVDVAPLLFVVPEPVPAPAAPKASPSAPEDKEDDEDNDDDTEPAPAKPEGKSSSKPVKTLGKGRAARNPLSEAKVAEIIATLQTATTDHERVRCLRALESSLANPAAFAEVERAAVGNNFATAEVACAILMRTEVELARRDALNVLYDIARSDRLMRETAIAYFVNKSLPLDGKAR